MKSGRYQAFTPELALAMAEETRTLLHHLVWSDRSFMEALTADYSFLTSELAEVYGVPAPKDQFEMVKFPADLPRAGILGRARSWPRTRDRQTRRRPRGASSFASVYSASCAAAARVSSRRCRSVDERAAKGRRQLMVETSRTRRAPRATV